MLRAGGLAAANGAIRLLIAKTLERLVFIPSIGRSGQQLSHHSRDFCWLTWLEDRSKDRMNIGVIQEANFMNFLANIHFKWMKICTIRVY